MSIILIRKFLTRKQNICFYVSMVVFFFLPKSLINSNLWELSFEGFITSGQYDRVSFLNKYNRTLENLSPSEVHILFEVQPKIVSEFLFSLQCRRPWCNSWVGKICWRRDGLPTPSFLGFPCSSAGKKSACNVGDLGLIPGLGRYRGEGIGCLENSMDSVVLGVAKSGTQLSDSLHFYWWGKKTWTI